MSEHELNARVKANIKARRHNAIKAIVAVLLRVLLALGAIIGLKAIGFISGTFMVILTAVAVCVGTFKLGNIWNDIKF
jgi:hypothetical protein